MGPSGRLVRLAIVALLFAGVSTPTRAADVTAALRDVLGRTPPGTLVRAIVRLRTPPADPSTTAIRDPAARRRQHLSYLKESARRAQDRLLAELRGGTVGALSSDPARARRFWIANAVALTADRKTLEWLMARPDVVSCETVEPIPPPRIRISRADPREPGKATWGLEALGVPIARRLFGLTGRGVRVGHLDTGVSPDHPDLRGKILAFRDFVGNAGTTPVDDEGHGTHTAGSIVGESASGRAIGVAPGARLLAGRIFGTEGTDPEKILEGMQWVVDPDGKPETDDGAMLVSSSWGSDDSENRVFWDAVKRWVELGVFPCFAAGNTGPEKVGVPAGYPHSFAVGAINRDRTLGEYSSRGPVTWDGQALIKPDVCGPGTEILSAWPRGNGYNALEGTSMACPHVAGVVALMLEARPQLTIEEARRILEDTATDLGDPGKDNLFGAGLVNAVRALGRVVPAAEVSGTIIDDAGQPIPAAEVVVEPHSFTVEADGRGRFVTALPPGQVTLAARARGRSPARQTVTVVAGHPLTLSFKLPAAADVALSGTVRVQGEERPLAARVVVMGESLPAVQTDPATGSFSVSLAVGRHRLLVLATGYEPRLLADVDVGPAGARLDVRLRPRPGVLLVDDDEGARHETYFEEGLGQLGETHSVWDTRAMGHVPLEVVLAYPVVVWQTGFDYQTALTPPEQEVIKGYLAGGGRLFLSGQVAGILLRNTEFFAQVLKARWVGIIRRSPLSPVPDVAGIAGDPIGDGLALKVNGPGTQDNQDYPTIIAPASAAATPILTWTTGLGAAGIKVEDGTSRLVYTSVGLEGLGPREARVGLLGRILKWLAPTGPAAMGRVLAIERMRHDHARAGSPLAATLAEIEAGAVTDATAVLSDAPQPEPQIDRFVRDHPEAAAIAREIRRGVRAVTRP